MKTFRCLNQEVENKKKERQPPEVVEVKGAKEVRDTPRIQQPHVVEQGSGIRFCVDTRLNSEI